jgi:hypothetical protein
VASQNAYSVAAINEPFIGCVGVKDEPTALCDIIIIFCVRQTTSIPHSGDRAGMIAFGKEPHPIPSDARLLEIKRHSRA